MSADLKQFRKRCLWASLGIVAGMLALGYLLVQTGVLAESAFRSRFLPDNAKFAGKGKMNYYLQLYRVENAGQAKELCRSLYLPLDPRLPSSIDCKAFLKQHASLRWEGAFYDNKSVFLWPGEYVLFGFNNSEDGRPLIGSLRIEYYSKSFDISDFYTFK